LLRNRINWHVASVLLFKTVMAASVQTSSFLKRTKLNVSQIAGTKVSATNSALSVSSGISSLDSVIDGGFLLGSLNLIEEDEHGSYSNLVTKYFLAEGVQKGNYLLGASTSENPWDLLSSLPSPVLETEKDAKRIESSEELKIAWRYENLSMDGSNNIKNGNSYDLSTPYTLTEEQKTKIATWDGLQSTSSTTCKQLKGTFKNPYCLSLLETVSQLIEKWQLNTGSSSNLLRIVISSFGSPFWQFDGQNASTDLTTTLMLLKSLMRSANAVAVVTVPHHLLDERTMSRSRSIADVVFQLKSLREDGHLQDLMDVHGILEVKKIANLSSLKPILGQEASTTYGFKATKRKFKIEKLHLPPSVEAEKTADNSSGGGSKTGCGSINKSSLDF